MTNEEIIQLLGDWDRYFIGHSSDDVNEALNIVIEILKEQKISRWIPVSERLPKEYKRVIVSDVYGIYIGQFINAEESWGGKHFIDEGGMQSKSVEAWMPLPEPYKAESEDKE